MNLPTPDPAHFFSPATLEMGSLTASQLVSLNVTRAAGHAVKVTRVSSGCWCTAPAGSDTEVLINYTAPATMPEYYALRGDTRCDLVQYVTVYFTDDSAQTITLTGELTI